MSEVPLAQLSLLRRNGNRTSPREEERVPVDVDGTGVTQAPWSVRQLLPMFAVLRMPHVISVTVGGKLNWVVRYSPVSSQHPELAIPNCCIVV